MATGQLPNPYIQKIKKHHLQLDKEIGNGSFGTVHLAYDKNRHNWCAVKCLSVRSDMSSKEKYSLEAEADKLFRIRDDNVISVFGLCIDAKNGFCGLVMPYMRCGSLQRLLRRSDIDFPWPLRIRIVYQIARGMNALHLLEPKVIHQDLKSGNVLLTDNLEAKVADFGVSRIWHQTSQSFSTTRLTGTLSHIPPEYFENMYRRPTTKFDIYSYGVTVWEILTRQQPYIIVVFKVIRKGLLETDVLNERLLSVCVQNGQRPDEEEIPQDVDSKYEVSTTIKSLMFRCWTQEPAGRPEFVDIVHTMKIIAEDFATEAQASVEVVKDGLLPRHTQDAFLEDRAFKYDAFVCYHDTSRLWVIDEVVPKLEHEAGIKLCLHARDWLAGSAIMENIIESIEQSRKTLLLVDNGFAQSGWCREEARIAYHRHLETQGNTLAVVLLEKVEQGNMDDVLRKILKKRVLKYSLGKQKESRFWKALEADLRK